MALSGKAKSKNSPTNAKLEFTSFREIVQSWSKKTAGLPNFVGPFVLISYNPFKT
jgi:hypothetical protein